MMERNIEARQHKEPLIGLEQLPNELLVYIPTSHDIVRLRYVSRKIKSISKVASPWNKLVWPWSA